MVTLPAPESLVRRKLLMRSSRYCASLVVGSPVMKGGREGGRGEERERGREGEESGRRKRGREGGGEREKEVREKEVREGGRVRRMG